MGDLWPMTDENLEGVGGRIAGTSCAQDVVWLDGVPQLHSRAAAQPRTVAVVGWVPKFIGKWFP
jgi:hypothetical protein